MPDQADGADERPRIRERRRLVLSQVSTSTNPARARRSAVSSGPGVVPRPVPLVEVRRERLLVRDLVRAARGTRRCFPRPPHCATSRPAGREHVEQRARTAPGGPGSSGRSRWRRPRRPARAASARRGPGTGTSRGRRAPRGRARPSTARRRPRRRARAGRARRSAPSRARSRSRRRARPRRRAAAAARAARCAHASCGREIAVVGGGVPVPGRPRGAHASAVVTGPVALPIALVGGDRVGLPERQRRCRRARSAAGAWSRRRSRRLAVPPGQRTSWAARST